MSSHFVAFFKYLYFTFGFYIKCFHQFLKIDFFKILKCFNCGKNSNWINFSLNVSLFIWNWDFTCWYFNVVILSNSSFLIWFFYWNAVCFCFQKVLLFFMYFVKFIYYLCCISLILSLNGFSFFVTVFDLWLLLLLKLINQNGTHIELLLCDKMLLQCDWAVAWQVSNIVGSGIAA